MDSKEKWLPVVGYEGLYEVSDRGAVRGIDRHDSRGYKVQGQLLSQALKPNGRLQVTLSRDGRSNSYLVHRLVARAFHGAPPPGTEVCHGDGNPVNNYAENLRWGTGSENKLDTVRHGTHAEARRTSCLRAHPLVVPNLSPAHAARGNRDCRACARARTAAKRRGVPFTQEIADEFFERLRVETGMGVQW